MNCFTSIKKSGNTFDFGKRLFRDENSFENVGQRHYSFGMVVEFVLDIDIDS